MEDRFLILDRKGKAVAHGTGRRIPGGQEWSLSVEDGCVEEVMKHSVLHLVCSSDAVPALEGRVVSRQGNCVLLQPVRRLEKSVWDHLRIPVAFHSYIYPRSGKWRGRESVVSRDLSCGGVAFDCPRQLEVGEIVEMVIPIPTHPLILCVKILRQIPREGMSPGYAGCFLDMVHEQESMVREWLFTIQFHDHRTVKERDSEL